MVVLILTAMAMCFGHCGIKQIANALLRLPLGTEAPVMVPMGTNFSFLDKKPLLEGESWLKGICISHPLSLTRSQADEGMLGGGSSLIHPHVIGVQAPGFRM